MICTIGPASSSPEVLEELIKAGMNVARLNFSHGTHEDHRRIYDKIRAAEAKLGASVAIMQDLQGPKIRLGKLEAPITIKEGDELILCNANDFVASGNRLPTTYPRIARDVAPGEQILLADGKLALEAIETDGEEIRCRVTVGGELSSSKGINLPGTKISIPSLTDKDREDLKFGLELGVDYVAISFVRVPKDVAILREQMERHGRVVPIISKIEKPMAVEYLPAIVEASEGIMVARGDLGVELPPEQVPAIQRRAIRLARERAKISVVATQMLMSMTRHARPTHAEVSDVANAVFDGTDAVMLSDETAAGAFPIKAAQTMAALCQAAESTPEARWAPDFADTVRSAHAWAIARAAVVTAEEVQAQAIISYTQAGLGPRLMASWRPTCEVLGCATSDESLRRMAFFYGVRPLKIQPPSSVEALVSSVEHAALDQKILGPKSTIVITSKMPFVEAQHTNMLKIHTISG